MGWLRANIGVMGLVYTLTAGAITLYVRAAMADTRTEVAVLKAQRDAIVEHLQRMEARQVAQDAKLDDLRDRLIGLRSLGHPGYPGTYSGGRRLGDARR